MTNVCFSLFLQSIPEVTPGVGVTVGGGVEEEDEAAKAVRSILGHNDLVAEADKSGNVVVGVVRNLRTNTTTNFVESPHHHHQSHEANHTEANKENSETKRSLRLKEKNVHEFTTNPPTATVVVASRPGMKRPACSTVEVQYVSSESKLDAPGKCVQLFVYYQNNSFFDIIL